MQNKFLRKQEPQEKDTEDGFQVEGTELGVGAPGSSSVRVGGSVEML